MDWNVTEEDILNYQQDYRSVKNNTFRKFVIGTVIVVCLLLLLVSFWLILIMPLVYIMVRPKDNNYSCFITKFYMDEQEVKLTYIDDGLVYQLEGPKEDFKFQLNGRDPISAGGLLAQSHGNSVHVGGPFGAVGIGTFNLLNHLRARRGLAPMSLQSDSLPYMIVIYQEKFLLRQRSIDPWDYRAFKRIVENNY